MVQPTSLFTTRPPARSRMTPKAIDHSPWFKQITAQAAADIRTAQIARARQDLLIRAGWLGLVMLAAFVTLFVFAS